MSWARTESKLDVTVLEGGSTVANDGANIPPADDAAPAQGADHLGKLRLFIGAAPGVGKTYTMLREANSLRAKGIDVVIGYLETHDRKETALQIGALEIVPEKQIWFQGKQFHEIDLQALVDRHPDVVVIDELAHSNVPGSQHSKRYMDVEFLLNCGMDVMTAVNVQHLEGVHLEAEAITGIKVREIIPTSFIKRAREIEMIDVTPETLRQRMRDGSIYSASKVEQALDHFFRKSNLSALRELALREVADDVDERLQNSFDRSKIKGPIGAKEGILVCVNYPARSQKLIEKAHRMAARMKADLIILTILDVPEVELSVRGKARLAQLRETAKAYHAEHRVETKNDRKLGAVIMDVAERSNVTQIVIGQPKRSHKLAFWRDSPVHYLMQQMKYVDVRIVGWKE